MKSKTTTHSDFWIGDNHLSDTPSELQLALHKRAVSNFVTILTNRLIPVKYPHNNMSFTDGNVVYISADLSEAGIDCGVGTALHEASHIVYTDFSLLKDNGGLFKHIPYNMFDSATSKGLDKEAVVRHVKDLWNYVEDRYIDYKVYTSAPGYRKYYKAMYDTHWHSKSISDVLKSSAYTDECIESYMFRIINLTNKNTRLNALNGLLDIAKKINLTNITRLTKCQDRLNVAIEIYDIILQNIGKVKNQTPKYFSISGTNDYSASDDWPSKYKECDDNDDVDAKDGDKDISSTDDSDFDINDLFGGISNSIDANSSNINESQTADDIKEVSKRSLERAKTQFERQKDFLSGNHKKKNITKEQAEIIDTIEESGMDLVPVAKNFNERISHVNCVVVKKLTKRLMMTEQFPFSCVSVMNGSLSIQCEESVNRGIVLGTLLGKKLKVRGESRNTVYNRKRSGKLDKRTLNELGYGIESVFSTVQIDTYKDAVIHISVDASSSMSGKKWKETMTAVVAISKAASMINNLNVCVSFRGHSTGGLPYVVIAYDSKKDKFSTVKQLFPYIIPRGCTPEGLCFEAINGLISPSTNTTDSYFLNFSDGEPYFSHKGIQYTGIVACNHTRKQINNFRNNGIRVMSYFISNEYNNGMDQFYKMYGKDAYFIDVNNITKIAHTMNKKFLEKV
jgi:hypothetical protein